MKRLNKTSKHSFELEQESEVWDKMWKKADRVIAIQIGCLIAGVISAMIVWHLFKDSLPEELVEAFSFRRGRRNVLPLIGSFVGLFVGEIASKILIKLIKLDK